MEADNQDSVNLSISSCVSEYDPVVVSINSEFMSLDEFTSKLRKCFDQELNWSEVGCKCQPSFIDKSYELYCNLHKDSIELKDRCTIDLKVDQMYNLISQVADKLLTLKCNLAYYKSSKSEELQSTLYDMQQDFNKWVHECYNLTEPMALKDVEKLLNKILKGCRSILPQLEGTKDSRYVEFMKSRISQSMLEDKKTQELKFT